VSPKSRSAVAIATVPVSSIAPRVGGVFFEANHRKYGSVITGGDSGGLGLKPEVPGGNTFCRRMVHLVCREYLMYVLSETLP